jgi:Hg(II)-responsive transcriptional regulator
MGWGMSPLGGGESALDSVGRYGVHDGVMRTSELAGRAGVNSETLRYYERRGLLNEPPRTSGGYRDYPDAAVELLRFVKRAQELGFTLDEVEELLHLDSGGPDSCDAARALAEARKADLEARIADLQRMRDSLAGLVTTCDLPRADRHCPLLATIATLPPRRPSRSRR